LCGFPRSIARTFREPLTVSGKWAHLSPAPRPPSTPILWGPIWTGSVFDELISPELALVCPDLRAKAIAALPSRQAWFPSRLQAADRPLRRLPPVTERAVPTAHGDVTVGRAVGAYALARAGDLLAVVAGIALFVLVLAAVAGAMRG
jgi:hypothetical protein